MILKLRSRFRILENDRNSKLQMSDWTQGSDSPLSNDKKTEWANYRTSLRDITNTYKSVNDNGFSWH